MKKIFGGIELGENFGGYEIANLPVNKLPQDVATAMGAANSNPLLGATYSPIWYVGKQTVNGVNYFFIAEDIRTTLSDLLSMFRRANKQFKAQGQKL